MHNILSPVPMISTLERAPRPASARLSTAYSAPSPATPASLQSEAVPPSGQRLLRRLGGLVRSVALALRYRASLSERTIEQVDTAQVLRRH